MSPILQTLANGSAYGYRTLAAAADGSFESIATVSGTGSSATITFSSIPSTYSALQFRIQSKYNQTGSATAMDLKIYFNGVNTGTSYAYHQLKGNGSTVTAAGSASQTEIGIDSPIPSSDTSYANMTGVGIIDIHDYASTSKNKTLRAFTGYDVNGAGQIILSSGLRASTDAITSVSFLLGNAGYRWTTDTVISLYGIKGA
jgi:hypothetical protein